MEENQGKIEEIKQQHAELLGELRGLYESHPELEAEAPGDLFQSLSKESKDSALPGIDGMPTSEPLPEATQEPEAAASSDVDTGVGDLPDFSKTPVSKVVVDTYPRQTIYDQAEDGPGELPVAPEPPSVAEPGPLPESPPSAEPEVPEPPDLPPGIRKAPELPAAPDDYEGISQDAPPESPIIPQKKLGEAPKPPLDQDYTHDIPDSAVPDLDDLPSQSKWTTDSAKNLNLDDAVSAGVRDPESDDLRSGGDLAENFTDYNRNLMEILKVIMNELLHGVRTMEEIKNHFHRAR